MKNKRPPPKPSRDGAHYPYEVSERLEALISVCNGLTSEQCVRTLSSGSLGKEETLSDFFQRLGEQDARQIAEHKANLRALRLAKEAKLDPTKAS